MKEEYTIMRENIFNSLRDNKQPSVPLDFFYRYYIKEFENQPKEKTLPRKDLFGSNIFDSNGNQIWEKIDTHFMNYNEFAQIFSNYLMMSFNDIFDFLDKKFGIDWLCDESGNKLKLIL